MPDEFNNALPIGTELLHKRYRIEAVLGHGGFGVVYKGWHADLEAGSGNQGIPAVRGGNAGWHRGAAAECIGAG